METVLTLVRTLPWADWMALGWFIGAWVWYDRWAHRRALRRPSVLGSTNRVRRQWMLQTTYREVRVFDGVVVQHLSTSPSFFASTTILIIGGLLATLGTTERVSELVRELPFAARTSVLILDLKICLLLVIFIHAFFRFTWCVRQYGFGALMVAAAPEAKLFAEQGDEARERFAERAGRVMALAAEAFNDGLRAYYMAFAAIAWLFSPLAFALATAGVVLVLYHREFGSDVLEALHESR